jgi:hypothetical protein
MCLLVKQTEIQDKKKDDDRKNSKKYSFLFGQVVKERKCKYVKHYVQMGQIPVLKKPLASKNRILDFAQFQNYKYILILETRFSGFLGQEREGS